MGYICHEFFLVVLHIPQLGGHVVQRGGEVSHLILGGHRDLVLQVAGGVLGGSLRDPAQRPVHQKLEGQQHNEGEQINDDHRGVDGLYQSVSEVCQIRHFLVDQQIALGGKALDHRRADGEYILLKIAVIVPLLVGGAAALGRIEILDLGRGRRIAVRPGGEQDIPLSVHQPYGGIRIGGEAVQLHFHLRA